MSAYGGRILGVFDPGARRRALCIVTVVCLPHHLTLWEEREVNQSIYEARTWTIVQAYPQFGKFSYSDHDFTVQVQ